MGDTGVAVVPPRVDGGVVSGASVHQDAAAGPGGGAVVLADLVQPACVVPADASVADVDELMRADLALRWVVLDGRDGPVLLTRGWLERALSGRFGYGRVLNHRRRAGDVAPLGTVVLPADCPIGHAAAVVTERRGDEEHLLEAVVVSCPGGTVGVAPVTAVFEQLAQHYAHQALHDPLTGLPNRLFLTDGSLPGSPDRPPVLLYIDLDRFKDVNDHLGHAAGDEVLVQFADRLRAVARAEDLVVRLAGDEFALVAAGPLDREQAEGLADRVMLAAATPFVVQAGGGGQMVTLGASVGVAAGDRGTSSAPEGALETLLTRADMAMYRAKSLGRGRSAHYDPALQEDHEAVDTVRARHLMERRLRAAIDAGGLHLQYQPVVGLPSGRVTGVEALARWHDDELGWVPPDVFVPLAERTGLVVDLGRWVLRTACATAATWPAGLAAAAPTVAVNVSPVQLAQRGFVDDVVTALAESGLAAERLWLEITETAAITDLVATAKRLEELRALGVRLALDDFGAGHSALALLRRLPVDLVKIDRSFIERVASDTADAVLVRLVIEAAHSLGRRVCAEGVETAGQAQQLVAMGCDSAQGWLFGRPQPAGAGLVARLSGRPEDAAEVDGAPALPLRGSDELIVVTTPDGIVSYVSAASGPLLGRLPQELVGTSVADLLRPGDLRRLLTVQSPDGEDAIDGVVHGVVHRDGGLRWLRTTTRHLADSAGSVREVLSVSRDVTAAVQAEIALADSEAMFRHAFDDAPIGMALTGLDGTFIRVNKAFAALLGRGSEEIGDSSVQELTHPEDLAVDDANLGELLEGAAAVHDVTKRYLHADGHAVPVVVHAAVVHDAEGTPAYVFAHVLPK